MIQHDLLAFALEAKYPQLKHGKDFLVAHKLHPETGEQDSDAFILKWMPTDLPEPDIGPLLAEAATHRPTLQARNVRGQRNTLLSSSDWTQGADAPASVKTKWAAYRQALRDLPSQPGFPADVTWPVAPQ